MVVGASKTITCVAPSVNNSHTKNANLRPPETCVHYQWPKWRQNFQDEKPQPFLPNPISISVLQLRWAVLSTNRKLPIVRQAAASTKRKRNRSKAVAIGCTSQRPLTCGMVERRTTSKLAGAGQQNIACCHQKCYQCDQINTLKVATKQTCWSPWLAYTMHYLLGSNSAQRQDGIGNARLNLPSVSYLSGRWPRLNLKQTAGSAGIETVMSCIFFTHSPRSVA